MYIKAVQYMPAKEYFIPDNINIWQNYEHETFALIIPDKLDIIIVSVL